MINISADYVVAAVGQQVDQSLWLRTTRNHLAIDNVMNSRPSHSENVYVIGDARKGPASIVEAIADAQKVVEKITGYRFDSQGLSYSGSHEKSHCLGCSTMCNTCLKVCPNRANVSISIPGKCQPQILHVDGMCNECGNCNTFCPYEGNPAKDKFTLFWTKEDFLSSKNEGFFILENNSSDKDKTTFMIRINHEVACMSLDSIHKQVPDMGKMIETILNQYTYLFP